MTTQWSATKKNSGVILSNGGLTATADVSQGYQAGSCDAIILNGVKRYWEVHLDVLVGPGSTAVGIDNLTNDYATGDYLGINISGVGYYDDGTEIFLNFTLATYAVPVVGDTICLACIGDQRIWYRVIHNGVVGGWNNDIITNQDPALNIGGQDISSIADSSPAYSVVGFGGPSQVTANFGATPFLGTPPSGYTGFDTVPVAPANVGGGFHHIGRVTRAELEGEEEAATVATTEDLPVKPLSRKMRKRLAAKRPPPIPVEDDEEEEAFAMLLAA